MHNKWSTYMDIAKWDREKDPMCQRCTTHEETFQHIFQCRSKHADNSHTAALKKFRDSLRQPQTAPLIQRAFLQCIESHRKGYSNLPVQDVIVSDDNKLLTRQVFQQQERLGLAVFMQGLLSQDWVLLQIVYNQSKDVLDFQTD